MSDLELVLAWGLRLDWEGESSRQRKDPDVGTQG